MTEAEYEDETTQDEVGDIEKMTDWAKEPKISDLKQNIDDATADQDSHKQNVDRWLANRAAERKIIKGQSNVAPKLIRKQAEWRYSSLADPFLSTPDIFNINPVTAGDVNRARQNQLVLNNQFNTKLGKVKFIDDYVRNAVDIGTVIVKVGWETQEEEITRTVPTYEYLPDNTNQLGNYYLQLLQLRLQDPEEYADHSTPGLDHALEMFQQTGQAMHARETGTTEVTKIEETKNQPTVDIPLSTNIIIDPSCGGDLNKASFIGEKFPSSLSELRKDGLYKNLDQIKTEGEASALSSPDLDTTAPDSAFSFKDKPRKKFIVFTYWGEWDIDGTGITKQIVASWVGDVCIRMELNPFPDRRPPFVSAVYMPVRESVHGEPDGELLKDNQDIIGAVTRGTIDLLAKSANSQTGMRKDMLDVTNRRRFMNGQDYEFNSGVDPRQGVYQHVFPDIPNSAFNMLSLQNTEAESMSGVKSFVEGINSQSLGSVASNARSALDAAARRELGILRRLSQGIIDVGRKIIAMNSEFLSDVEVVRITDKKFIEVRRDDLAGNFDLRLTISTAEEDARKAEELAFMLQTAGSSMDLEFSKMIWADIALLRKRPELAEKIENYQVQPDPMAQQMQMMEMKLKEAQIEKEMALAYKHRAEGDAAGGRGYKDQAQGNLNNAKVGEAQAKGRQHNSEADQQDLDYIQESDGTTHIRELQSQDNKASNDLILESVKANKNNKGEQ
jgi:hypothetical protein